MKILMIGPFPQPLNGMTIANKTLAEGLRENGHRVQITRTNTSSFIGSLEAEGKLSIRRIIRSLFPILQGIALTLFGEKSDVVYISSAQSEWGYLKYTPFIFSAWLRKIPVFIHIHGGYFRTMFDGTKGWKRGLIKKSLELLSGAVVLGPSLRYMFEGVVQEQNIFICPNAVEDEIFATKEEIEEKISRWEKDDTIRIIYLSNLMRSKGILDLLEAVQILRNKKIKVHLDVAGAIGPDVEREVRRYFSELDRAVTYHGVVQGQGKKELLLQNYIFCLPSKHPFGEGQPISILEAMATGCVPVVTDIGGIKDTVTSQNGFLALPGQPDSIADKLIQSSRQIEKSLKNYKNAKRNHTKDLFITRMEKILFYKK